MIDYYENIPLSNFDIIKYMNGQSTIILYPDLYKYKSIDEVLGPYNIAFILLETRKNYGHWTCLFKNSSDEVEFFNPYGGIPDSSLDFVPYPFKKESHQDFPYLTKLLFESPYEIFYNEFDFQKHNKYIKTCGRHCVVRIWLKHLDIYQYKQELDNLCKQMDLDYDGVVTILTTI